MKTIQDIESLICYDLGIDPLVLHGKTNGWKASELTTPRQIVMYFALRLVDPETSKKYTLSKIGEYFGRDHATVIHARKTILNHILYNKCLSEKLEGYRKIIDDETETDRLKLTIQLLKTINQDIAKLKRQIEFLQPLLIPDITDGEFISPFREVEPVSAEYNGYHEHER